MPIHGNKILSRYKTYYESEMIRLCSCAPATPFGIYPIYQGLNFASENLILSSVSR